MSSFYKFLNLKKIFFRHF